MAAITFTTDLEIVYPSGRKVSVSTPLREVVKDGDNVLITGSDNESHNLLYSDYGYASSAALYSAMKGLLTNRSDYFVDVAMGRVPNTGIWNKFGYNADVGSATPEIIASFGGAFDPTTAIMATAQTFTITYNQATDGEGTTGATVLLIYYIDANYASQIAFHTLGNDGSDVTSFSGFGINRALVYSSGGSPFAVNAITITATSDGTTQAQIPASASVTQQCIFHTQLGWSFLIKGITLTVRKLSGGSAPRCTVIGYSYSRVTGMRYEFKRIEIDTGVENTVLDDFQVPIVFNGREVIYFTCETNTDNTSATLRFSGIEQKN